MGLHKDRHGTYYARVKVPKALQEAVAQVLANGKTRQVFLKRSLSTKSLPTANVRVKPVLVQLDRVMLLPFATEDTGVVSKPLQAMQFFSEIRPF